MLKKRKRALTLIEIMAVMVLIGIIGSVVAYNVGGGLKKGRKFQTEQAARMLRDVLLLTIEDHQDLERFNKNRRSFLMNTHLIKDPDKILKDGWNEEFTVVFENGEITVSSRNLKDDG